MSVRGWLGRSKRLLDHDPEIDRFRTLWREQHIKEADLAVLAGLAAQTVHKMFDGQTKRPQHLTYAKLASAMGCEYALQQIERPDYDKEVPKAKADYKDYLQALAKSRARALPKKRA